MNKINKGTGEKTPSAAQVAGVIPGTSATKPANEARTAQTEQSARSTEQGDGGARGSDARGTAQESDVSGANASTDRSDRIPELREPDGAPLASAEEQARARVWAQANGKVIDSAEFHRQWKEQGKKGGAENEVVVSPDHQVIFKRNHSDTMGSHPNHASLADYFDHLAMHNELFPECRLNFEGLSETEHGLAPVVSQKFVRSERAATPAEIKSKMEELGFTQKGKTSFDNPEMRVRVGDLHDQNVLVDQAGELHFIDPIIKRIAKET